MLEAGWFHPSGNEEVANGEDTPPMDEICTLAEATTSWK